MPKDFATISAAVEIIVAVFGLMLVCTNLFTRSRDDAWRIGGPS